MELVMSLVEKHPWNNMVQLKCHLIFEDVLSIEQKVSKSDAGKLQIEFLQASNCVGRLIKMAEVPTVKFGSGNSIRNGYMGFVIKLGNVVNKMKD